MPLSTFARMAVAKRLGKTTSELPREMIVRFIQDGHLAVYDDYPSDAMIVGVVLTPRDPVPETTIEVCGFLQASEAPEKGTRLPPDEHRV